MYVITSNAFFWLSLIALLIGWAVLPTIIAVARQADEIMLIVLVNVLGCATVFGWPIALVMAMRWPRRAQIDHLTSSMPQWPRHLSRRRSDEGRVDRGRPPSPW